MKKLIDEMLSTPAGRESLMDSIPLVFEAAPSLPRNEEVPLDRIAWCARHRVNTLPASVVDEPQTPIVLNRYLIAGEVLYVAHTANHHIERFVEAGRKTISATVQDFAQKSFALRNGRITEYRIENPATPCGASVEGSKNITAAEAEVLKSLGLVKDETVPAPPRKKRRFHGCGFGD